jgi:hypothetical protein
MSTRVSGPTPDSREQKLNDLLEEARKLPGIPEVMRVYGSWTRTDQKLDTYRAATQQPYQVIATDHSNPR